MIDVDEVLVALAEPTRRRLLDALGLRGPQTATAMTLFGQILDADEAVRAGLA